MALLRAQLVQAWRRDGAVMAQPHLLLLLLLI
jgi:hypothetical protein